MFFKLLLPFLAFVQPITSSSGYYPELVLLDLGPARCLKTLIRDLDQKTLATKKAINYPLHMMTMHELNEQKKSYYFFMNQCDIYKTVSDKLKDALEWIEKIYWGHLQPSFAKRENGILKLQSPLAPSEPRLRISSPEPDLPTPLNMCLIVIIKDLEAWTLGLKESDKQKEMLRKTADEIKISNKSSLWTKFNRIAHPEKCPDFGSDTRLQEAFQLIYTSYYMWLDYPF